MSRGQVVRGAVGQNHAARSIRNVGRMQSSIYWHSVLSDDPVTSRFGRKAMSSYYVMGGTDQQRMGMLGSMITVHTGLYPEVPVLVLTESEDHAARLMQALYGHVEVRCKADGRCADYDYGYGLNAAEMVKVLDKLTGSGSEQSTMHVYNSAFVHAVASQQPLCITSLRELCREARINPALLGNMPGLDPADARVLRSNTDCFYKLNAKLENLQLSAVDDAYTNGENMLTTVACRRSGVMLMVMPQSSEARNALLAAELVRIREVGYDALLIVDGMTLSKDDPLRKAVEELVDKGGAHCMVCLCAANALTQCCEQVIPGVQAWCMLNGNLNAKEKDTLLAVFGNYSRHDVVGGGGAKHIHIPILGEHVHWGEQVGDHQCIRREDLRDNAAVLTGKDKIFVCRRLDIPTAGRSMRRTVRRQCPGRRSGQISRMA